MSQKEIYYVPEKKRKYYFASNGEYDTNMDTYLVNGYTLWANLNALDTITNPATVLVTELKDAKSYMYRVKFKSKAPDIFEKAEHKDDNGTSQYVFFVPLDRFLRFESINHCVPVPENNWEDYSFRFHALAAFYRLNVIPSLSMPLFEREDLFLSVCDDFYRKYHFSPPLNSALSSIFCSVFYALDFFGFLAPTNLSEKDSVDAARKLADSFMSQQWGIGSKPKPKSSKSKSKKKKKRKTRRRRSDADNLSSSSNDDNDNESVIIGPDQDEETEVIYDNVRSFAFTEIKFAIERYHSECFSWRQSKLGLPPDIFDHTSFCALLNAVQKIRKALTKLHLLPSDAGTTEEALRIGVNKFQELNKLPLGPCDLFTTRRIWDASSHGECDTLALCRLCGMETKEPEVPVYMRTLGELHVFTSPSDSNMKESGRKKRTDQIETVLNEAFSRVRDRSEAQQLMMSEAQKSVQMQISRVDKSMEHAKKIFESAEIINEKLESASKKGKEAEMVFGQANEVLDRIMEEHDKIRNDFILIKRTIDDERNGNKILFFVNIILFVVIVYRFVKAFK